MERRRLNNLMDRCKSSLSPVGPDRARGLFEERTIAFCITPGRSGTQFATFLLNLVDGVVAKHEPLPCFSWVARDAIHDSAIGMDFWLRFKLPSISSVKARTYVETSHMFAKGFVEPLLEMGANPKVLLVGRPPRNVALSFLEKYTIPERTWLGMQWLLHPEAPGSVTYQDWKRASDYQLCFWYALEMERRSMDYERRLASIGIEPFEFQAKEMHEFDRFLALIQYLNASPKIGAISALEEQHRLIVRYRYNKTTRRNLEFFGDLDSLEAEVWRLFDTERPDLREHIENRYSMQL